MLKTHTGRPIVFDSFGWSCGECFVPLRDIREKRPGCARQMRRMVAKAKRRERRGYVPPAVKRARAVSAARAGVRFNGEVIGYASNFKLSVDPAQFDRVHEVRASSGTEGPPIVIDVSSVPPAELDELKARLRAYVDSAKASDWRPMPLVPQDNILHCRPGGLFEEKPVTAADLELWRSIPTSPVPTPSCMTCYDEGIVWDTDSDDHEVANPCWLCPKGEEYARAEREFNEKVKP